MSSKISEEIKLEESPERIFINPLNSLLGHSLIKKLKEKENAPIIIGKRDNSDESEIPEIVDKVFESDFFEKNDYKLILMDCSIIIIEILKTNYDEIEKILRFLEDKIFSEKKKIIFISHPLIWYQTKKKSLKQLAESDIFQKNEEITNSQNQNLKFTKEDFQNRRSLPCNEIYRLLENKLFDINKNNSSIDSKILLPGIFYGQGEEDFYPIFENCLNSQNLFIYGDGENILPCIYILDFANCILKILENNFEEKFFICVDQGESKQKEILFQICENLKLEGLEVLDDYGMLLKEDYLIRSMDLNFKCSDFFERKKNVESISDLDKGNLIDWKYQSGLVKNFNSIFEEFVEFRGLRKKKILLYGLESAIVENDLIKKVSEKFEINYYLQKDLISEIIEKDHKEETFFSKMKKKITEFISSQKELILEERLLAYNKNKKKFAEMPNLENIDFDIYKNISKELLVEIYINLMKKPNSIFKGFLLYNFPRDKDEAFLFLNKMEEEGLKTNFDCVFNIFPDVEFMEEDMKEHYKLSQKEPEKALSDSVLAFYEKNCNLNDLNVDLMDFFKENDFYNFEILYRKPDLDTEIIFKRILKEKIEEEVIPVEEEENNNLIENEETENKLQSQQSLKNQEKPLNSQKSLRKTQTLESNKENQSCENNIIEKEKIDLETKKYLDDFKAKELERLLDNQEKEIESKVLSLKQYLADNILPELTEGIIEICKEKPEDPMKFLISFLKKKVEVQENKLFGY